jgi:hypothetical protein
VLDERIQADLQAVDYEWEFLDVIDANLILNELDRHSEIQKKKANGRNH